MSTIRLNNIIVLTNIIRLNNTIVQDASPNPEPNPSELALSPRWNTPRHSPNLRTTKPSA